MKYSFILEKLLLDGELRYHRVLDKGRETVNLIWDDENASEEIPKPLVDRLLKTFDYKDVKYAMEGNEETGWYVIVPPQDSDREPFVKQPRQVMSKFSKKFFKTVLDVPIAAQVFQLLCSGSTPYSMIEKLIEIITKDQKDRIESAMNSPAIVVKVPEGSKLIGD